jgi:hypothetical protein
MAAYLNRTISLMSGPTPNGRPLGPPGDTRKIRDSSPLQIFVNAKKKINDIFTEIEDYVGDSVSYMRGNLNCFISLYNRLFLYFIYVLINLFCLNRTSK